MKKLPRVVVLQLKRFHPATGEKNCKLIKVSKTIDFQSWCHKDVAAPPTCTKKLVATNTSTSPGSTHAPNSSPTTIDPTRRILFPKASKEDNDLEEATRRSLSTTSTNFMTEDEQMAWAMQESMRSQYPSESADADQDAEEPKVTVIDDETPFRPPDAAAVGATSSDSKHATYRLASMIRHTGASTGRGHYVCDVLNVQSGVWKSYNDTYVKKVKEEEVFGVDRMRDAYILFYLHDTCFPTSH